MNVCVLDGVAGTDHHAVAQINPGVAHAGGVVGSFEKDQINAIAVAIRAGMTVEALGQVDFVYSSSSCSIWDPVQIVCGQAQ